MKYLIRQIREVIVEAESSRDAIDIGTSILNDMHDAPRTIGDLNRVVEASISAKKLDD